MAPKKVGAGVGATVRAGFWVMARDQARAMAKVGAGKKVMDEIHDGSGNGLGWGDSLCKGDGDGWGGGTSEGTGGVLGGVWGLGETDGRGNGDSGGEGDSDSAGNG